MPKNGHKDTAENSKMTSNPSAENTPRNSEGPRPLPPQLEANKWRPGCPSPNPGGRPKRKLLTEVNEEMLQEKLLDPVERARYKDAQWNKLLASKVISAMTLQQVWDRTEGKLVTPIDLDMAIDIKGIIEAGRRRLDDDSPELLEAEEVLPQLGDGKDGHE